MTKYPANGCLIKEFIQGNKNSPFSEHITLLRDFGAALPRPK
jgi:hypothetical protein